MQWQSPQDNGSPVSAYRLERDEGVRGDFQLVYAGPSTQCMAAGLRSGQVYGFRLLAENDVSLAAALSGCLPAYDDLPLST